MPMKPINISPFDTTEHLKTDQDMLEFLQAALEEATESQNTGIFISALNAVARLKGISKVAGEADLGRESLYKSLSPSAKPRFDTILKVIGALGLSLDVVPKPTTANEGPPAAH